ncbi:uracil-DNA glycosylase [Paenibacillus sp. alder61]|uniref:uracil-DNA glycosylase n=1 Tax=Paenibacillus sp. alder61 TaxID=2862948 RepID=UPI001CD80DAD|nr:uracil-DNA glycosylase [Paenibacillus sp. alder61]MCA1292935.1 uracil-DNA glycosylase [Paenibacillus sp. alder61]
MFGNDWDEVLQEEVQKPYFQDLRYALAREYKQHTVYPPKELLFSALKLTPYERTRVVILGQDPYHGPGQAHGLSFSVMPGVRIPPSLQNIYKELESDLGISAPNHGYLLHWAEQGVLMLNAVLTVREGQPNSHKGLGWEQFTDAIMMKLNERLEPLVFILWGSYAQQKGAFIDRRRHKVIRSPHPSPLSAHRGFLGSRPFSQTNDFLREQGLGPIDWALPDL